MKTKTKKPQKLLCRKFQDWDVKRMIQCGFDAALSQVAVGLYQSGGESVGSRASLTQKILAHPATYSLVACSPVEKISKPSVYAAYLAVCAMHRGKFIRCIYAQVMDFLKNYDEDFLFVFSCNTLNKQDATRLDSLCAMRDIIQKTTVLLFFDYREKPRKDLFMTCAHWEEFV